MTGYTNCYTKTFRPALAKGLAGMVGMGLRRLANTGRQYRRDTKRPF